MTTNNIFNFRRFGKYLVTDLKRCTAQYGLSMLAIVSIGLVSYICVGALGLLSEGEWLSSNTLARAVYLSIASVVLIMTMPSKCYGFVTDKRAGSDWLMLPASTTEKFLSMMLNTLIIIPSAFLICWFVIDWIIVLADPGLETTIIAGARELFVSISEIAAESSEVDAIVSGYLLENGTFKTGILFSAVDDIMWMTLTFLLGAVFFKTNKAAKTILTWIAVSTALSFLVTPLVFAVIGPEMINSINGGDAEVAIEFFNNWFSKALTLDNIIDITLLIGTATAIFFRIRTIKH